MCRGSACGCWPAISLPDPDALQRFELGRVCHRRLELPQGCSERSPIGQRFFSGLCPRHLCFDRGLDFLFGRWRLIAQAFLFQRFSGTSFSSACIAIALAVSALFFTTVRATSQTRPYGRDHLHALQLFRHLRTSCRGDHIVARREHPRGVFADVADVFLIRRHDRTTLKGPPPARARRSAAATPAATQFVERVGVGGDYLALLRGGEFGEVRPLVHGLISD